MNDEQTKGFSTIKENFKKTMGTFQPPTKIQSLMKKSISDDMILLSTLVPKLLSNFISNLTLSSNPTLFQVTLPVLVKKY